MFIDSIFHRNVGILFVFMTIKKVSIITQHFLVRHADKVSESYLHTGGSNDTRRQNTLLLKTSLFPLISSPIPTISHMLAEIRLKFQCVKFGVFWWTESAMKGNYKRVGNNRGMSLGVATIGIATLHVKQKKRKYMHVKGAYKSSLL